MEKTPLDTPLKDTDHEEHYLLQEEVSKSHDGSPKNSNGKFYKK